MRKNDRITPEGTRDLLFEECFARRRMEETLSEIFEERGFMRVETPGLEFYDVFDPESSGIGQEVMYKTADRRGRLVVMRPDSTLPVARLAATRLQNLPKPLRLYYTQPVYRSNPDLLGRSDETMQTGIELLGAGGARADLEVIAAAVESLRKCAPGFRLELGHAGIFRSLVRQLPVSADAREDIRGAVETKNYAALDALLADLGDDRSAWAVRQLPRLFGGEEVFEKAAPLCTDLESGRTLQYLRRLYRSLSELGLGESLIVDLGLVQRNDYYTGIVFSAYVEGRGDAVLLGGRYDNLLGHFGPPAPAVGFAVNVDALAAEFLKRNGEARPLRRADVLVHGESGFEVRALRYAASLGERGLRCENSVFPTEEEALRHARETGIARVDVVGEMVKSIEITEAADETDSNRTD